MTDHLIIGDIAGRYHELMELLGNMPEGHVISVGDMVDRGRDSNRVIDFFMRKKNASAILGNHEHMMVDALTKGGFYQEGLWEFNGGIKTIQSYRDLPNEKELILEHVKWLSTLPKYIELENHNINGETKNVFISHAFLPNFYSNDVDDIQDGCNFGEDISRKGESTIIWNRGEPIIRQRWDLQVCGHNSQFGLREWRDQDEVYAICLDDSRHKKLTGLHLETMKVYQVDYKS